MASMRSMILDGRIKRPIRGSLQMRERYELVAGVTEKSLGMHDTILVNITSVVSDIRAAIEEISDADWKKLADFTAIPCPKPPFRHMWLEARSDIAHHGFLVERSGTAAEPVVQVLAWIVVRGDVVHVGQFMFELDAQGSLRVLKDKLLDFEDEHESDDSRSLNGFRMEELWVLHAFGRMNCHNVKLVPMTAGAPKQKKNHPPFSVWHEIVVTSMTELRKAEREAGPDGEKRELRFHKVRGHYADYTKGKGLFGRLKIRIWIEEHTAGEPELGTVVGSYKVE